MPLVYHNRGVMVQPANTCGTTNTLLQVWQNGTLIGQLTDNVANSGSTPYTTGVPGIGGEAQTGTFNAFGWKSWQVTTSP